MAFLAERAFSLLRDSHEQGRLAHAYLITGEPGSGKRKLALDLVNLLTGQRAQGLEEARGGAVQIVQPESKSRRIRVDALREVGRRLHLAAGGGSLKIAVILDADRLMPEAANAFLKTLEEPPKQSLILLLTAQPGQLLPTTRSRCLHVPLFRPGGRKLTMEERKMLDALRDRAGSLVGGGLSGALSLLQAFAEVLKEVKGQIEEEHAALFKEEGAALRQRTEGDWLKQREENLKGLTEAMYLERRDGLLQVLLAWYGDALRSQQGVERPFLEGYGEATAQLGRRCETRELLRRIRVLEEMRENLQTNVSEGLAMEVGFLGAFG